MFIGHFGVAMAAKRWAPRTSLPVLILAGEFIDVLWPILLIAGVEHVRIDPGNTPVTPLDFYDYPWTHSLVMCCVWAAAFALVYYAIRKYRPGAIACGVLVVSHWLLDFISHRPDLPLIPGGHARVGLGLWYSRPATAIVEGAIFAIGVWFYSKTAPPRDRTGRWNWWAFVVFLAVIYAVNIQGNAPPSVAAVAWTSLLGTLILFGWAWLIERHRVARSE